MNYDRLRLPQRRSHIQHVAQPVRLTSSSSLPPPSTQPHHQRQRQAVVATRDDHVEAQVEADDDAVNGSLICVRTTEQILTLLELQPQSARVALPVSFSSSSSESKSSSSSSSASTSTFTFTSSASSSVSGHVLLWRPLCRPVKEAEPTRQLATETTLNWPICRQ